MSTLGLQDGKPSDRSPPVSKLLVEILEKVFLLLSLTGNPDDVDEDSPEHDGSELKSGRRIWDWLVITRVCRNWRGIALGYPILWTHIDPRWSEDRVRAYMERSQKADLYIVLPDTETFEEISYAPFYQIIRTESDRINDFSILDLIPSFDWKSMRQLFTSGPMRRLRKLRLRSTGYEPLLLGQTRAHTLLSGARLNHLSLSAVYLPWNHQLLRGLCELILEDINDEEKITVSELLDILEGCPNLTLLKLSDAGPKFLGTSTRPSRSIALPQLRNLSIDDFDFRNCEEIFGSLRIPPETAMFIGCNNYPFQSPVTFPVAQLDRRTQRCKANITITDESMTFQTLEDMENPCVSSVQLCPIFDIDSDEPDYLSDAFRCIPTVLGQPFWGTITALEVDMSDKGLLSSGSWHVGPLMLISSWVSLLSQLHEIQDMKLLLPRSTGLTSDFVSEFTRVDDTPPHNLRCPNLRALDLIGAEFGVVHETDHRSNFNILLNHLVFRHRSNGGRLRRFSLIRCNGVTEQQYDSLQQMDFYDEIQLERS